MLCIICSKKSAERYDLYKGKRLIIITSAVVKYYIVEIFTNVLSRITKRTTTTTFYIIIICFFYGL